MTNNFTQQTQQYGQWALVAGAAEGIGAAFSHLLASKGINLILVDVDRKKLDKLADEIGKMDREVIKLEEDLSARTSVGSLMMAIKDKGCRLVIYNAAYGPVKPFLFNSEDELDRYIDTNSRTPLHLTFQFCEYLVEKRQSGGLILMSSLAGMFGTQLVTPYGATKAFDFNLAEGLYHEMKKLNIHIMACIAGATDTPNYRNTKPRYPRGMRPNVMNPEDVAEQALNHLGKSALFIPGRKNRLIYFLLSRVLSRRSATRLMNDTMDKMYSYRFK